jgi:hypothetical protein
VLPPSFFGDQGFRAGYANASYGGFE